MNLELTKNERSNLRKHKIRKADILDYAVDELSDLLQVSYQRAEELYALADFQRIPSVGIKFAQDLYFLGFRKVEDLKDKIGPSLLDTYEKQKGFWTDPCVEDQFWLVVHFAKTQDRRKRWWDFTESRKKHRSENGYPKDRPETCWYDLGK